MTLYLIWLVVTVAVMGAKYLSVKVISKLTREVANAEMRVSKSRVDIKVARANLEVANRNLIQVQNMITSENSQIERLTKELVQLREEDAREMQKSKEKLSLE